MELNKKIAAMGAVGELRKLIDTRSSEFNHVFLIVGGLYWVTALRKTGAEVKVYTKHQGLTQASKHHKQSRSTTRRRSASCCRRDKGATAPWCFGKMVTTCPQIVEVGLRGCQTRASWRLAGGS